MPTVVLARLPFPERWSRSSCSKGIARMLVPDRVALTLGSLALRVGGSVKADAQGNSSRSAVVGHVYVNDNTAPLNTIGAFDQHADGTLTTMSGSPFATGGAGAGTIVGSQ